MIKVRRFVLNSINAPKERFIIIDSTKRSSLCEGRTNGMGFAFCKRNGNVLELVQPLSPCKDYCNDVVYSEQTGKPFEAYGLKTSKKGIFEDGNGYLLMSILNEKNGKSKYPNFDRDLKYLEENHPNQQKIINWFEEQFKVKERTQIIKIKDNLFLAIVPLFWVDGTYKISLYTLLLRNGIFYRGEDCMEFLNTTTEDHNDVYSIKAAIPKIKLMLRGNIPRQDLNNLTQVHNTGFVNFKFPIIYP